jgi:glycosyltransferase A (GT-A) superfamily protein (DUF2064 family)/8-oxo-dGTP pyrophosphatase MutT (NUDIX family)
MSPPRLLVTAKAPQPGRVKTRLCPPLGLRSAARLGHAFTVDALAQARSVDAGAGLLAPANDIGELTALFPGVPVVAQHGRGLADALEHAVAGGATVVSGDAPCYPPELIRRGLASTADLVLGPSLDGGYCLIGMRRFHSAPFRAISWSTGHVLEQTLAAASAAGLTTEQLDPAPDIDTIDDLLAYDLRDAVATAAVLDDPAFAPFLPRRTPAVAERRVEYESPWRRLVLDRLDGGRDYSYLETPRAVWVVPITDDGDTMFVRQYRHPVRAHPLEMPAGSIELDETPAVAAARELREEVGGVARELRRVGGFYSSSAHLSLKGLVFLATGVVFDAPTHAGSEGIETLRMPFARALQLAESGELCEAQSALAVILAGQAL